MFRQGIMFLLAAGVAAPSHAQTSTVLRVNERQ